jgi:lipoate-protein ligase B
VIERIALGRIGWRKAWDLQQDRREGVRNGQVPEALFLLEHPPTLTAGRRALSRNLLRSAEQLKADGVDVVQATRGGDWTYHGPGQVVVYAVIDLSRRRLRVPDFVGMLEGAMLEAAKATVGSADLLRRCEAPGLWARHEGRIAKLGAVGIHVAHGISVHGLALNVDPDPWGFGWIVACGLEGAETTSLRALAGREVDDVEEVGARVVAALERRIERAGGCEVLPAASPRG